MEKDVIKFGTLRKYLSVIDRLSLCMNDTLSYENFVCIGDVPEVYDELYVYGIGMKESEFYAKEDSPYIYSASGDAEDIVYASCIEIMLSEKSRYDI